MIRKSGNFFGGQPVNGARSAHELDASTAHKTAEVFAVRGIVLRQGACLHCMAPTSSWYSRVPRRCWGRRRRPSAVVPDQPKPFAVAYGMGSCWHSVLG